MDALLVILIALWMVIPLVGHVALWVVPMNRLNALAIDHRLLRIYNRVSFFMIAAIPVVCGLFVVWTFSPPADSRSDAFRHTLELVVFAPYLCVCWIVGGWMLLVWFWQYRTADRFPRLLANHTECVDLATKSGESLAGSLRARLAALVPGNQALHLRVNTKEIVVPGMPAALDGFSIVHLADLHMAEHLRRPFHEAIVDCANALDGDLVAITGDIVDRRACIEWIPNTLGKLRSRRGVFFVLGNHDERTGDVQLVRDALTGCGLIDLGGSAALIEHQGTHILLTGNELPWQKAPPTLDELPVRPDDANVLSILLAHSPDQFAWARKAGFKLMLAGHTHGGQGRLPLIGAVLTPCISGVKYAAGVFYEPPTLLHVTRGISGMMPVRLNCPPELTKLVLRAT